MGKGSYPISKQHGKGKRGRRGRRNTIDQEHFEVRRIVIAQGLQFTNTDFEHHRLDSESNIEDSKKKAKEAERLGDESEKTIQELLASSFEKSLERFKLLQIPDPDGKLYGKIILKDRKEKEDGKIAEEDPEFPYEYHSRKQRVTYRLLVVKTKKEFKEWLQTDKKNVIVIYDGHSRYGRGACFGYPADPGDRWGDTFREPGADEISKNDGLFRLGYDVIGMPLEEIVEHRYHAHPLQVEEKFEVDKRTCHPAVVNAKIYPLVFDRSLDPNKIEGNSYTSAKEEWGSWQWDREKECFRVIPTIEVEPKVQFTSLFAKFDPKQQFWGYRGREKDVFGKWEWKLRILLRAGWKGTTASPWEIGNIEDLKLKCKVFCHFGCSSLRHFRRIIRGNNYMEWKIAESGRYKRNFACFTTGLADSLSTPVWLFYLLRFSRQSRNRSWGPALSFACKKGSKVLKNKWDCKYKIVLAK